MSVVYQSCPVRRVCPVYIAQPVRRVQSPRSLRLAILGLAVAHVSVRIMDLILC